jgi:L-cystine uptake protein TcyP (sodium:dicarboxylate symporter family)
VVVVVIVVVIVVADTGYEDNLRQRSWIAMVMVVMVERMGIAGVGCAGGGDGMLQTMGVTGGVVDHDADGGKEWC